MKLSRVNRFHDPASFSEKIQEEDLICEGNRI